MKNSLQKIRNTITKKEETLKNIQHIYPHLAYLTEAQILAYFEADTIPILEKRIYDNLTEQDISICSCTDNKGHPKDLYASEEFVQKEADTLAMQKKVKLKVYSCPNSSGWHLTKR